LLTALDALAFPSRNDISNMQLTDFKVLSFDCYGTLIDWESGIILAAQPLLARIGKALSRDQALETFARHESSQQSETPSMLYSRLLSLVHIRMAKDWGVEPRSEESEVFGNSIRHWPAFADSLAALQYLKQHYKLVILSNVDRESFKVSNARLQVEFDFIFTAQDIGSYKPDPRNFEYLIRKLGEAGFQKHEILHSAESLFHDHLPANRAGIASAWIYRRQAQQGFGATAPPETMPKYDFKFGSMAEMAEAHRAALGAAPRTKL
jgi:2-haloacid dehalogenase